MYAFQNTVSGKFLQLGPAHSWDLVLADDASKFATQEEAQVALQENAIRLSYPLFNMRLVRITAKPVKVEYEVEALS